MHLLDNSDSEAVVRAIKSSAQVKRRYQFFVWSQSYLRALTPHDLAVCGAYQRTHRDIVLEAFNSTPVPPAVLANLTDPGSVLVKQIIGAWIEQRGQAVRIELALLGGTAVSDARDRLIDLGFTELIAHGVARPQRPTELESLFILSSRGARSTPEQFDCFDMMLPHLHSTYLRMQETEREVIRGTGVPAARKRATATDVITRREKQILVWVREGKSNQEIGEQLEISALTVKNHVQKILRKLGALNRGHAVAKAMTLNLLATMIEEEIGAGEH